MKRTANLFVQHLLWRGFYFFSVLILNILISRFFAAGKSGQIFYIVNNLSFVLLLASLSLESAVVYYISSGRLNSMQMARFCVLWILLATTVAGSGWWLALQISGSAYSRNPAFWGSSLFFISGVLMTTFFSALFYAKKQFGLPNKILAIINGLLIILLISGSPSGWTRTYFLSLYFFSYFLQGMVLMIAFFIWLPGKKDRGFPPAIMLKPVFYYSLTALAANVIHFLVSRMDYWFVKDFCSAQDLGNYIQASKLAQMLLVIPSIFSATLFPLIASADEKENSVGISAVVRILCWINLAICLAMAITGYWLFPFLFGASFSGMFPLFLLLIPGIICLTANYPIAAWNSGKNQIKRNIRGSLVALTLIAAGDFFILPYFGVTAAAVISSVGYFSCYAYLLFFYQREKPVALSDFFIIKKSDLAWFLLRIKQMGGRSPDPEKIELH